MVDHDQVPEAAGLMGSSPSASRRPTSPAGAAPNWVKVPLNRTQEVVIIGYKANDGQGIRSLVLAVPDPPGHLRIAGGVGTVLCQSMPAWPLGLSGSIAFSGPPSGLSA